MCIQNQIGTYFGSGLYRLEVDYLLQNEFAKTSEDILWRRTKLGLYLDTPQQDQLRAYIVEQRNNSITLTKGKG